MKSTLVDPRTSSMANQSAPKARWSASRGVVVVNVIHSGKQTRLDHVPDCDISPFTVARQISRIKVFAVLAPFTNNLLTSETKYQNIKYSLGLIVSNIISFLIEHEAEAGDSTTFNSSIWTAAAQHVEWFHTKGGPKTVKACASKWNRVSGITFNTGSNSQ